MSEREDEADPTTRREVIKTTGVAGLGCALTATGSAATTGQDVSKQHQEAEKYFKRVASTHGGIDSRTITFLTEDRTEWRTTYEYTDGSKKTVYRHLDDGELQIRVDGLSFTVPVKSIKRRLNTDIKKSEEDTTKQVNNQLEKKAKQVNTTGHTGYTVNIGEDRVINDADSGDADDNSLFTGTGFIKADWINDSPADPDYPKNSAVAIANANPGASVPNGAAQIYAEMKFEGSSSQTVEFNVNLDYNVQLLCYGGGGKMTVQTFIYDYGSMEFLEKDKVRDASKTGNVIQIWGSEGTTTNDMFVEDVSPGDILGVGTRVIVSAGAAGVSDAVSDAWPKYPANQDQHTKQNYISIDWQ